MRIREQALLRQRDERRTDIIHLEDLTNYNIKCLVEMKSNWKDSELRLSHARKTLDDLERKLREDIGLNP